MCRLSYNTWRRGLFSLTDEDYRWAVVRRNIPVWAFKVLNFTFIAVIQNILLFLLGLPAATVLYQPLSHSALGASDYLLAAAFLVTLALEFTADNQQYSYQSFKHAKDPIAYQKHEKKNIEWPGARFGWTEEDRKRGFITRGLWAWSRHPNFACEQTLWFLTALFPILSYPSFTVHDTSSMHLGPIIPPLALALLFAASTAFSESITYAKYPVEYAAYQERVGMFMPFMTVLKGVWLSFTGKKETVDALIWNKRTGKGKKA